jgi:hypothetical protein
MRVACASTPEGNVYRFYRTEPDVAAALKPIVPILLASHVDIVVGRVGDDPALLMQVGPISGAAETTLLNLIEEHVTPRGESAHA